MNKAHVTKLAKKHGYFTPIDTGFTTEQLMAFANALEDSVYQRLKQKVRSEGYGQPETQKQGEWGLLEVFVQTKSAAIAVCKEQDLRTRKAIADLTFSEVVK